VDRSLAITEMVGAFCDMFAFMIVNGVLKSIVFLCYSML
jgi:hypothetical protein